MPTKVEMLDKKYRDLKAELETEISEFSALQTQHNKRVNRLSDELSAAFFDSINAKIEERHNARNKLSGGDK